MNPTLFREAGFHTGQISFQGLADVLGELLGVELRYRTYDRGGHGLADGTHVIDLYPPVPESLVRSVFVRLERQREAGRNVFDVRAEITTRAPHFYWSKAVRQLLERWFRSAGFKVIRVVGEIYPVHLVFAED